uniref:RING-type domain-containing protein n=1 Tax=Hyaloperonospora arabidopsidis (strain Emoy2) TaxID=559515 RepID=M4BBA2_HYAAE
MGREHVHYLDCEQGTKENCVYTGSATDQRRHCTRKLEPPPEKQVDEVLHEQFWKTLGWEDPCTSKMELELFGKCGFKCDAPDHDEKPSYCCLAAWHKPEPNPRSGFDGCTYVGGHKVECSHVASGGKMHHVFVLDRPGSMHGQPWNDLMAAWREFVYNRIAEGATLDLNITTMTNAHLAYRGGGTNHAEGFEQRQSGLRKHQPGRTGASCSEDGWNVPPRPHGQRAESHILQHLGFDSTHAGLALAKPDHERNCVICGQDLASGETVKLEGCRHELHMLCLDVLMRNAAQDEEVARCPSCRRSIVFT